MTRLSPKQRLFLRQAARLGPVGGLFTYDDRYYMRTATSLVELGYLACSLAGEHQQYQLTPVGLQSYLSQSVPKRRKDMRYLPHEKVEQLMKVLYPGKPTELFAGPHGCYEVEKALYLFFYGDRPVEKVCVSPLALAFGYDREPKREDGILTYRREGAVHGVIVEQERMDSPFLVRYQRFPLLFASLSDVQDPILIDGRHRLKRAYEQGIEYLYGYTLDSVEVGLC